MTTRKKKRIKTKDARGKTRGGSSYPCTQCGGNTHVRTTRRAADGSVTRNRQCLHCDHVFDTIERAAEEPTRSVSARAGRSTRPAKKARRVSS